VINFALHWRFGTSKKPTVGLAIAGARRRLTMSHIRVAESLHGVARMADEDIYAKLTPIFREVFDDEALVLQPQLTAADVPEWDSVSHVRLVLTVERAFGTRFPASELGALANVGDLVSLIRRRSQPGT
jgi:acyl carrier protein